MHLASIYTDDLVNVCTHGQIKKVYSHNDNDDTDDEDNDDEDDDE